MDVERTMEFILEQQAKSAVWQQKTDRKMAGLQKLVVMGMKMLAKNDREHAEFRKEMRAIKKEQADLKRESDARFERLMAALLRQRPNGRH